MYPPTYPQAYAPPPPRADFSSMFSGVFRVWSENFLPLFLVYLVLTLVTGTISVLGGILILGIPYLSSGLAGISFTTPTNLDLGLLILWEVAVTLVSWVLTSAVLGGVTDFAVRRHRGEAARIQDSLNRGFRRLLSILGANILVGLIIVALVLVPITLLVAGALAVVASPGAALGLICAGLLALPFLGVLAIYISIALSLFAPAIMMEGAHAVPSLERSWTLTKGHKWSLFAAGLVLGLVYLLVDGAIVAIGLLSGNAIVEIVTGALAAAVAGSWFTLLAAVAYDLIVRTPAPMPWPATYAPAPVPPPR